MSEPLSLPVIDELFRSISITVSQIVRWRMKIKRLKDELAGQKVIEDDFIYTDLHSFLKRAKNGETPLTKTFPMDGVELKVTIAHRHKGESVFGVDLVYEISDTKIALLQYKKSNQRRFSIDRTQLRKLRHFCYDRCPAKKTEGASWFAQESRLITLCPCYYDLISPEDELIIPACVVESILGSKQKARDSAAVNEFGRGFSKESFNEMFSKCWIGAIYALKESVSFMMDTLLSEDHLVVHCEENGTILKEKNLRRT